MDWVYQKEEKYIPQYLVDEMNGMGEGMCAAVGRNCNVTEMTQTVKRVNMLPELIRMACTAFGAWGAGSGMANGNLIQLRALDFGGGPFVNYTVVTTYREEGKRAYAAVSFAGFAGIVTGVAQDGVGISEKVWMTYNKYSLQPGSYDGEADIFVLRDLLAFAKNRAEAEAYVQQVPRTWGIFIGVGDFESQKFDLIAYKQESAVTYTDETMPSVTGQPYMESVCYVDKHPQPSGDGPNGTLPTALADHYGNINQETVTVIVNYHQTGDVHIAAYDFGASQMIVSIGRVDHDGKYGVNGQWKAFNRPYLRFDLNDLWAGN